MGWLWWQQKHTGSSRPPKVVLNTKQRPIVPSLVVVEHKPDPVENTSKEPPALNSSVNSSNAALSMPGVTPLPTPSYQRPVKSWFEAQIAMARHAISPGSIDGTVGSQTRAAFVAFQRAEKLSPVRSLDTNSMQLLTLEKPLYTTYIVTTNDIARLQPLGKTWLAKSQQTALDYETIQELVGETAHCYPTLIQRLNPGLDWNHVAAGTILKIPDVAYPPAKDKAAWIVIHLSDKYLEAFDTESNLMVHFPCSIAAKVEKRPVGELHVAVIAPNPNYTFDPEIFPESPEAQAIGHKLVLKPGPNNPVGVAWIGLDRPGYGMHGTPSPEQIGHTESHGCFRLANWDAEYLVKLVWVGMPVEVLP